MTDEHLTWAERQYGDLLHNLHAGVVVHGADTQILMSNPMASELLGLSVDQLKGRKAIDPAWCFLRNDGTRMPLEEYPVNSVTSSDKPLTNRVVGITRPDRKDTTWVLCNAFPVKGDEDRLLQVIVTFIDITERKKAEEEKDRILNLSDDLICIAGMDGYFKYVNPAWQAILGYTEEELLSRPFLDFIHPDDHVKNDDEVDNLSEGKSTDDFENRYIHKDGSVRTISWRATPLPERKEMYCVGRDVTGRKRAEAELAKHRDHLEELVKERTVDLREVHDKLRASEERFRTVFEQSADAVVLIDSETGKIVEFNDNAHIQLGYAREEFVALAIADVEVAESDAEVAEHIEKITTEGADTFETKHRTKTGDVLDILVSSRRMLIGGKAFIQSIWRDITERKEAENALRMQSTELRTMVNAMSGREVRMAELKEQIKALRGQLEEAGLTPVVDEV